MIRRTTTPRSRTTGLKKFKHFECESVQVLRKQSVIEYSNASAERGLKRILTNLKEHLSQGAVF